jgi:hypothetical protein
MQRIESNGERIDEVWAGVSAPRFIYGSAKHEPKIANVFRLNDALGNTYGIRYILYRV